MYRQLIQRLCIIAFSLITITTAHTAIVYTGIHYHETGVYPFITRKLSSHEGEITSQANPSYTFSITNSTSITPANRLEFLAYKSNTQRWQTWIQVPQSESFEIGHYEYTDGSMWNKTGTIAHVIGNNSTYSRTDGYFDILEIEFDNSGDVTKLAANAYINNSRTDVDNQMTVTIRYNSSYNYDAKLDYNEPLDSVPEPATLSLITLACPMLLKRPRRKS
ncbi:hypothetical protein JD969_12225 [Planctomycetota bacterium]|nr:hypothetical protein JD969_12225 [Planctomycetota bacterium]